MTGDRRKVREAVDWLERGDRPPRNAKLEKRRAQVLRLEDKLWSLNQDLARTVKQLQLARRSLTALRRADRRRRRGAK